MEELVKDVEAFHKKYGIYEKQNKNPGFLADDVQAIRLNFMLEELIEYAHACGYVLGTPKVSEEVVANRKENKAHSGYRIKFEKVHWPEKNLELAIDGLVDLIWVAVGTALFHGFGQVPPGSLYHYDTSILRQAWERVWIANMEKVKVKSAAESKRGDPNDIIKPPGWKAPTFNDLLGIIEWKQGDSSCLAE